MNETEAWWDMRKWLHDTFEWPYYSDGSGITGQVESMKAFIQSLAERSTMPQESSQELESINVALIDIEREIRDLRYMLDDWDAPIINAKLDMASPGTSSQGFIGLKEYVPDNLVGRVAQLEKLFAEHMKRHLRSGAGVESAIAKLANRLDKLEGGWINFDEIKPLIGIDVEVGNLGNAFLSHSDNDEWVRGARHGAPSLQYSPAKGTQWRALK